MLLLITWILLGAATWSGMAALVMVAHGRWPEAAAYTVVAVTFAVGFFSSPGPSRGGRG